MMDPLSELLTRALCLEDIAFHPTCTVSGLICLCGNPSLCVTWSGRVANGTYSFSSRVMVLGVNAIGSEVPMPQFTATLRNLCFPPWCDSQRQLVCSWCCIVWLLHLSVHVAFCMLLYSVCPYWVNQINELSLYKAPPGVWSIIFFRSKQGGFEDRNNFWGKFWDCNSEIESKKRWHCVAILTTFECPSEWSSVSAFVALVKLVKSMKHGLRCLPPSYHGHSTAIFHWRIVYVIIDKYT